MSNDLSNTGIMHILLVENSKTARSVLETVLSKANFQVKAVATGPQALEYLENKQVDLVLLDVFMPLMNGYEVAEIIRSSNKQYASLPIVAYTSSQLDRDRELCFKAGINDYLIKSDNTSDLVSHLAKYRA